MQLWVLDQEKKNGLGMGIGLFVGGFSGKIKRERSKEGS